MEYCCPNCYSSELFDVYADQAVLECPRCQRVYEKHLCLQLFYRVEENGTDENDICPICKVAGCERFVAIAKRDGVWEAA